MVASGQATGGSNAEVAASVKRPRFVGHSGTHPAPAASIERAGGVTANGASGGNGAAQLQFTEANTGLLGLELSQLWP